MFTDSHCHLTDSIFAEDLPEVLGRARSASVTRMVSIASDPEDGACALELARRHTEVWCTAGVHPHAVSQVTRDALTRVRALAAEAECVAIGETGLDYFYDHAPREDQRKSFAAHLQLAAELDLPVVVHSRDAEDDMSAIMADAGKSVTGVLHCFGGSRDLLDLAMSVGWFVSFTGTCTYKRFDRDLIREVPADRYMIETDAPYLAPVPNRGKRNEPSFVPLVAATVAEIRGEDLAGVAAASWSNATAFYGLDEERP